MHGANMKIIKISNNTSIIKLNVAKVIFAPFAGLET
jgi:hypothetical protein